VAPSWPLSLLASRELLGTLRSVLLLLLQLRWAQRSLTDVRYAAAKRSRAAERAARRVAAAERTTCTGAGAGACAGAGASAGAGARRGAAPDGLQQQMVHLVGAVLQHITDRVVAAGAWFEAVSGGSLPPGEALKTQFGAERPHHTRTTPPHTQPRHPRTHPHTPQAVSEASSLDEMHAARAAYMAAVERYCLLGRDGVARLVREALGRLLDGALRYCVLASQLAAADAQLAAVEADGGGGEAGGAKADAEALRARAGKVRSRERVRQGLGLRGGGLRGPQSSAGRAGRRRALDLPAHPPIRRGPPAHPAHPCACARAQASVAARRSQLLGALGALRSEYTSRQRLLLRVLSAKAAEAGAHVDELRQLERALDFNRHFERQLTPAGSGRPGALRGTGGAGGAGGGTTVAP
jgi:hypothetical protein